MEASSQSSTVEETKANASAEIAKLPYSTYRDYFDDSYKVTPLQ
jgi:hypothetical protein